MSGDTMHGDAATHYERGYNDELDDAAETPMDATRDDQRIYWQGVEDARRSGHLCCLRMKPRTEART